MPRSVMYACSTSTVLALCDGVGRASRRAFAPLGQRSPVAKASNPLHNLINCDLPYCRTGTVLQGVAGPVHSQLHRQLPQLLGQVER